MKNEKIILKHNNKKYPLIVGECNLFEKFLGLMFFKQRVLLLFNLKKPRRLKIHSLFCSPFLAVYTDKENNIQEIIPVNSWRLLILPVDKYNKLVEIPRIPKYSGLIKGLLEIPLSLINDKSPSTNIHRRQ